MSGGVTCPASFEFIPSTQSCYLYQNTTRAATWPQLQQLCAGYGAHLLAVDDREELDFVTTYVVEKGACDIVWTAGEANLPRNSTNWSWHISANVRRPVTYFDWYDHHPENKLADYVIVLVKNDNVLHYHDLVGDLTTNVWALSRNLCFLCEIESMA